MLSPKPKYVTVEQLYKKNGLMDFVTFFLVLKKKEGENFFSEDTFVKIVVFYPKTLCQF